MSESTPHLERILEGALLAAGRPLSVQQLAALFEEYERPDNDAIRAALEAIRSFYQERGFELKEVASGYRFQVIKSVAPWVGRLWEEKPQKYSRALLETLALIAYRQPITRGDIEEIRGVAVSSNIVKTLQEREWIRVVGHKDVPGRPAMYATTRKFLDYFDLRNLDDLPSLAELRDLDSLNGELALEGADTLLPGEAEGDSADAGKADAESDHQSDRETDREVNHNSAPAAVDKEHREAEPEGSQEQEGRQEKDPATGPSTNREQSTEFDSAPDGGPDTAEDGADDAGVEPARQHSGSEH